MPLRRLIRLNLSVLLAGGLLLAVACPGFAEDQGDDGDMPPPRPQPVFDEGRLLATGGVSNVEGVGGGGLVPWALITGYGSKDGMGVNAHETYVPLRSYTLHSAGAALGFHDRLELSFAHDWFDTRGTGGRLGLGGNFTFEQNDVGVKLRLFGKAVYDQDTWLPQTAIGAIYKDDDRPDVLKLVGAKHSQGTDFYIAATKLLLRYSLLLDATVRLTRADQFGILGFGGDRNDHYQPEFEGSVAYLVSKRCALGAEYRQKPDNLGFAKEQAAYDVFAAYFLDKHVSLTLAYVDLGSTATAGNQDGAYASLQVGF
jgi:hypothetical protein